MPFKNNFKFYYSSMLDKYNMSIILVWITKPNNKYLKIKN